MSYGRAVPTCFGEAALFLAKILDGSKPASMPLEQPTKFDPLIEGACASWR
jgi:putative ABC transport system substrate-binding protein